MSEQGYQPHPLRKVVADHVGGGTPSRQVPSYWRGHIPWASVKDFPEQSGVLEDTEEHISTSGLNASASNLIPAGTPLVCTRMAVGRAAMPSVPVAINQDVKALFPAPGVSPAYLLKLLQFIQPKAEAQAVGSTVKGIRIQDYLDIKAPIADADAQPVMARVLDTLDTAIHETEAIIAKLKAVKQGLLHDLLTRGIDANGELRPPHADAPHLYKESPLGWIPKEWEVKPLHEVGEAVTGSTPPSVDPLAWGSGTPFITPSEIADDRPIADSERQVSARGLRYVRLLPAKTIVVVCIGSTIGKVGITAITSCTNQQINAVLPHLGIHPDYLFFAIRMHIDQLRGLAGLQAVPIVNKTSFESIYVPVAQPSEQIEIAKRLDAIGARIFDEDTILHKLRLEKTGLVDDLLTGRVRVAPLLAETAQQPGSA